MISSAENLSKWAKHFDTLMKLTFNFSVVLMIMLFLLIADIFMFSSEDDFAADNSDYGAWCEEYHPELTYSECSYVAGW